MDQMRRMTARKQPPPLANHLRTLQRPGRKTLLGFVLIPQCSLMTFSCAREAFRMANERVGVPLFQHFLVGVEKGPIAMDGGERLLPDVDLDTAPHFDIIFLISGIAVTDYRNARLESWLRARSRSGSVLAPIGCSAVLAARAGLLDDHRCVTHWTLYDRFRTEFPKVKLVKGIFCIDGAVMTAAGGVAAFDLGLALVGNSSAADLVAQEAEIAIHDRPRPAVGHQRAAITWRYGVEDARLVRAIALMESRLEDPLPLSRVAEVAGVSVRQLERLCRTALGRGPRALYREIRLRQAQSLLCTTRVPLAEIALACGFADASHLSRRYAELFGVSPSSERRVGRRA